ncbi:acetate--CoA ligase family protein [Micromonospora sp. NPDC005163]
MSMVMAPDDVLAKLGSHGIPVPRSALCADADAAGRVAAMFDTPVALKAAGLVHKSDGGGVVLGLEGSAAVAAAAAEVVARLGADALPLLVQEMAAGVEILVGARRDPQLGVTVTVGAGGVTTELQQDVVTERAPVGAARAREMLAGLRCWPLLTGYRGDPPRDVEALCAVVEAVSGLLVDDVEICELDLNPVMVGPAGEGVVVVDARMVHAESDAACSARPRPSLERMLAPRHVVVVGVSDEPSKVGARLFRYLRSHGYQGRIDPVHPFGGEVDGIRRYASLSEVPGSPDLVCVTIPSRFVLRVAREAVDKGVGGLLVHSSDFAESGEDGRRLQEELARTLREGGVALAGPNDMGVVAPHLGLTASISGGLEEGLVAGSAALLTSSGALGSCLATRLMGAGMGLSYWIHAGNEADVVLADYLAYLAADRTTTVAGLLLEDVKDGDAFVAAGHAMAEQGKPVFAYNMVRSDKGRQAALSHTGAMVGSFAAREAVLRAAAVVGVRSLRELEDAMLLAAAGPLPRGNRLLAVTFSGGACSIIADETEGTEVVLPVLSETTRAAVTEHVPSYSAIRNPFDLSFQMLTRDDDFEQAITKLTASSEFDAVMIQFTTNADPYAERLARRVIELRQYLDVPLYVSRYGGDHLAPAAMALYRRSGVPVLDAPDRAARAIAALMRAGSVIRRARGNGEAQQ